MFPKIQMSRQARWLRFWQGAPVWVLASRSRCAFSPLDKSSWERCEGSSHTIFILPPDPPACIPLITQPGLRRILNPPSPSLPRMNFPLFNGFPYYSHQDYSFSSPSPRISSPLIFICLLSLSGLWDDCVVIFQWASIWKSWTSLEISANASYWFTLL